MNLVLCVLTLIGIKSLNLLVQVIMDLCKKNNIINIEEKNIDYVTKLCYLATCSFETLLKLIDINARKGSPAFIGLQLWQWKPSRGGSQQSPVLEELLKMNIGYPHNNHHFRGNYWKWIFIILSSRGTIKNENWVYIYIENEYWLVILLWLDKVKG